MGTEEKEKTLSELIRYRLIRKELLDLLSLVGDFRRGIWQKCTLKRLKVNVHCNFSL
jgi:hypothetical protein